MSEQIVRQAVVLAGGMGMRLRPFTEKEPKPMYPVGEKPFIGHLMRQIKAFGIENVLLLLGYKANSIMDYLGDGKNFGLHISYDVTPVEFQTGDRIFHAKDKLEPIFVLMYCDNYCPINFDKLREDFFSHNALAQVSVYENRDHYTKSNIRTGEDGKVLIYDKKRTAADLEGVDIGYAMIRRELLGQLPRDGGSFEEAAYSFAAAQGRMFATITKHRYYSIGSWERMELTRKFFENRPTVFLDRDGTVNVKAPKACYIENSEQFVWLEGAKEAVRLLKENGFRVLIVTNQPGIARGNLTGDTLEAIHKKMQRDLEQIGAEIDKIYYCPHDWEEGCECRKPRPGMLYQAQKDYHLDLTKCVMIGDDERDMAAGRAAGCKTCQVTEQRNLLQIVKEIVKGKQE